MSNTALAFSLSLISSKGGVGKSTIAINLSCALADMGLKVLCIDLDSQQSLSKFFQYEHEPDAGILEFIIDENLNTVSSTHIPGVSIIVNNDYAEKLNDWMNEQFSGSFALKKMLAKLRPNYDVIIIDTQGRDGRGQAQEMALIASDAVIVPTTPDIISAQELPRSIDIYSQVINGLADMGLVNEQPPILRVLINRVDHTLETKEVTSQIRKHYSNLAKHISVLKTVVPQRVVWRNCISKQQPAHRYDTSPKQPAKEVIESVIHELMPHYSDLSLSLLLDSQGGKNE